MSLTQTARVQTCMCSAMQSRLEDLKTRKKQKQALFQEVQKKYGKTEKVQKILLSTFQSPHSSLSIAEIDKRLQKSLKKFKNSSVPSEILPTVPDPQNKPQGKKYFRRPTEDEAWGTIIKLDSQHYLQEEQERFMRTQENQKKLKRILDQQVESKNQKILKEAADTKKHDIELAEYIKTQKQREKAFEQELKRKNQSEREMMNDYLAQVQKRKMVEMKKNQEYEECLVKQVKDEMRKEMREKLAKKEREKKRCQDIYQENEERRKSKMQEMEREKMQDLQIMKDYKNMLDKQEQDRVEYLKNREVRIQTCMAPESWRVLESMRHKNLSEDFQIHRNMQEQFFRIKAKEDFEQEQRVRRAKEIREFYEQQTKEKLGKLRKEMDEDKKIVDNLAMEDLKYLKFQEEREKKEKELKQMNAEYLKQQIVKKKYGY